MTLLACRECNNPISSTAFACPKCGALKTKKAKWPWIIGVPVAIITVMIIYGSSIPEYQSAAREVRVACEDMVKLGRADPQTCQTVYRNMITKGKEAAARAQ